MTRDPYLRICELSRAEAESARRDRARKAYRTLAFWIAAAVFLAVVLCVGLAARGDSGTWRLPVDRVDSIEIGRVYDGNGCLTLTQLVFWEQLDHGDEVVDWRLLKPGMEPYRVGPWWVVTWLDNGRLVRVYARSCYWTWLQHDSELARRENFGVDRRRKVGQ